MARSVMPHTYGQHSVMHMMVRWETMQYYEAAEIRLEINRRPSTIQTLIVTLQPPNKQC